MTPSWDQLITLRSLIILFYPSLEECQLALLKCPETRLKAVLQLLLISGMSWWPSLGQVPLSDILGSPHCYHQVECDAHSGYKPGQTAWDGQEQIQTNLRVLLSVSSPWLVCLLCADLSLEVMMRCTAGLLGTATNDRDHCALYSRQVQVQSRFYDNILWIFYGRLRTCKVSLLNIKYTE